MYHPNWLDEGLKGAHLIYNPLHTVSEKDFLCDNAKRKVL